jgi:hypothetical protein
MKRFYNIQAGYDLAQVAVNAVYGILEGFDYFEDFVDYKDAAFSDRVGVPQQHTHLHVFLQNLEVLSKESAFYDVPHSENFEFIESYLRVTGLDLPKWFCVDEIDEHSPEVKALIPKAAAVAAEAAFEILFNDREFPYEFQLRLREVIKRVDTPHPANYYEDNMRVKRVTYLPKWLERAVYHRDRGRCQDCLKDVSGEVYHLEIYHMDHVLPLADGGTNDPTNFQLLCQECNLKKGRHGKRPRNRQIKFWSME